jgi:hypothetical protein
MVIVSTAHVIAGRELIRLTAAAPFSNWQSKQSSFSDNPRNCRPEQTFGPGNV